MLSHIFTNGDPADKPRVEPKWTRRNDEWVQVLCEIQRGPGGLSDRPAAIKAGERK